MRLLPSCHEVQTNLTEYAEGALPVRQRIGIWVHLLFCRVCAGFLRGLKALPNITKKSLAPPDHAPDAAIQALAQVQAALRKTKELK
jgi:anti-sigma factor ChrR (cupin superfamily)